MTTTHRTALAVASSLALVLSLDPLPAARAAEPEFVAIEAQTVAYREAGEFLLDEAPVNGPIAEVHAKHPFEIMRRQVTRGEYGRCVAAGRCKAAQGPSAPDLPVVGVSYDDAVDYAAWLSAETGETYRLPTDREWAIAAGSRYVDDGYGVVADPDNPAKRWLSRYESEAARARKADPVPRPAGGFGENEHGLLDVAGNVWEWTSTCFARHSTYTATGRTETYEICGVRVAEGSHRAYLSSFVRDPRGGACSVGVPPDNLGIRLVRDDRGLMGRMQDYFGL